MLLRMSRGNFGPAFIGPGRRVAVARQGWASRLDGKLILANKSFAETAKLFWR